MNENKIHIGTSGWSYQHWKGNFYPENLKENDFLNYYSKQFHTVEVNNTFYHLPEEKTIKNWTDCVPDNFIFSVKASRYITHLKKLKDAKEPVNNFLKLIETFGNKTGPILFQFPPHFSFNAERLGEFINILPKNQRYTFEFRDPNWFNDLTYEFLKDNNIAFCIYYMGETESPTQITSDFVYIRFHGAENLGAGGYSDEKLKEFAKNIKNYYDQGKEIFCYFNNDEAGYAVKNALKLKELINNVN